MKRSFNGKLLGLKQLGITPIKMAKVVNPKEKPGLPGSMLEIVTNVTGIVKLKRNIPKIPNSGYVVPQKVSKADIARHPTAILIQPK